MDKDKYLLSLDAKNHIHFPVYYVRTCIMKFFRFGTNPCNQHPTFDQSVTNTWPLGRVIFNSYLFIIFNDPNVNLSYKVTCLSAKFIKMYFVFRILDRMFTVVDWQFNMFLSSVSGFSALFEEKHSDQSPFKHSRWVATVRHGTSAPVLQQL